MCLCNTKLMLERPSIHLLLRGLCVCFISLSCYCLLCNYSSNWTLVLGEILPALIGCVLHIAGSSRINSNLPAFDIGSNNPSVKENETV